MCQAKLQKHYLGVKVTEPALLHTQTDVNIPTQYTPSTLASHEYSPTCRTAIYQRDMNL